MDIVGLPVGMHTVNNAEKIGTSREYNTSNISLFMHTGRM